MKKLFNPVPLLLIGLLIITACGKEQPAQTNKLNDPNCIIGNEEKIKDGRIIGSFMNLISKSQMLTIGVGPVREMIGFDDTTSWTWSEEIKNNDDLKKKKGCILVDFKSDGDKKVATSVQILSPVSVPREWLIDNAALKKLMKGFPNVNRERTIVDSRPGPKFAEGSIPGSISIPLPEMKNGKGLEKLPVNKDALIVFYCGGFHCKLAPTSVMIASKNGYTNVRVYHAGHPD